MGVHEISEARPVESIYSAEIELTGDFKLPAHPTTAKGERFGITRLLVRVAGEPVGFVTIEHADAPLTREAVLDVIEQRLASEVELELEHHELPSLRSLIPSDPPLSFRASTRPYEPVTVVVCTRDRPQGLKACLESMRGLAHPAFEIIVVDNAPTDETVRGIVESYSKEDGRFRYAREPHPGLSWARNRGIGHATGEIVAFTDDDVRVDQWWIRGLLRGFHRRGDVACVTGLVASASLERASEQYFDARVWWASSCKPQIYDGGHSPIGMGMGLHPYAAGGFGTGANFAFRTEALREVGGFDESLGAGSPCGGGEDLDIFVRLLRRAFAIAYEPAALVWHEHRADEGALNRQMYSYGKALSAYLFKYASSPQTAYDLWRRLPEGISHLSALGIRSGRAGSRVGLARDLLSAEMRGVLVGPFAYTRSRFAQSRERRRLTAP